MRSFLFPQVIAITALSKVGKGKTLEAAKRYMPDHAQADCSDIAREWAREQGFEVFEDFVREVTAHPERFPDYDRRIDEQTVVRLHEPPLIITGRVPHYFAAMWGIDAFKVSLYCPLSVRAERSLADGIDPRKLLGRDVDDNRRYREKFGFTLPVAVGSAPHQVHLAICTRDYTPDEVAQIIYESATCWANGRDFQTNRFKRA